MLEVIDPGPCKSHVCKLIRNDALIEASRSHQRVHLDGAIATQLGVLIVNRPCHAGEVIDRSLVKYEEGGRIRGKSGQNFTMGAMLYRNHQFGLFFRGTWDARVGSLGAAIIHDVDGSD
jgi:hypothetical protein